jgi:hypothetical protein
MTLTPRLIAIQGIGFSAIEMAVQGFLEIVDAVQPSVISPFVCGGGGRGGGPDANLSLSDYLKKFGKSSAMPVVVSEVHTPAPLSASVSSRKKRQRMEAEIFELLQY